MMVKMVQPEEVRPICQGKLESVAAKMFARYMEAAQVKTGMGPKLASISVKIGQEFWMKVLFFLDKINGPFKGWEFLLNDFVENFLRHCEATPIAVFLAWHECPSHLPNSSYLPSCVGKHFQTSNGFN